jgi:hypothetical protein
LNLLVFSCGVGFNIYCKLVGFYLDHSSHSKTMNLSLCKFGNAHAQSTLSSLHQLDAVQTEFGEIRRSVPNVQNDSEQALCLS